MSESPSSPSQAMPASSAVQSDSSVPRRGGPWRVILLAALLGGGAYAGYLHVTGTAPWQQAAAGGPGKGGAESDKGAPAEKGGSGEKGASDKAGSPGKGPPGGARGPGGPIPVVAVPARTGEIDIKLAGLGTVTPLSTVTVRSRVDGQLMRVHFEEGQEVRKDQLLAEIDPRPYTVARTQVEGQLARDEALLANARVDLERYRTLLGQDSIAKQQVDAQEALVRQYEGVVKTDQGLLDSAKLQLAYARITAPVSGRVGLRLVDPGNIVRSGDANGLVVIAQVQPIAVAFTIPQDNLPAVLEQTRAGEKLVVEAWDRDQKKKLATGVLAAIDNQVDTATGTVKLKARFRNADGSLFPNQFVNVRMKLETLADVTLIPAAAIQRGGQGMFAYVVKDDMTVTARPLKLGPVDGGRVVVESGIAPGERVVLDGIDRLREGASVILTKRPEFKPSVDGTSGARKGGGRKGADGKGGGRKGADGKGAGGKGDESRPASKDAQASEGGGPEGAPRGERRAREGTPGAEPTGDAVREGKGARRGGQPAPAEAGAEGSESKGNWRRREGAGSDGAPPDGKGAWRKEGEGRGDGERRGKGGDGRADGERRGKGGAPGAPE